MRIFNGKARKETANRLRQSIDRRLRWAEREVASHPEAGLLLATIFGIFLGTWVKRK